MRTPALAAALALALVASPGHAAPFAGCLVLTDAAGDVTVRGADAVPATLPDGHLDVRAVYVGADRTTLAVRIDLADVSDTRMGVWRLTFTTRGQRAFVEVAVGSWVNVASSTYPFRADAAVEGGEPTQVPGNVDHGSSAIHVRAPLTAFRGAAPRPGDVLNGFVVESREDVLEVGPVAGVGTTVTLADTGSSNARYAVGRRC